LRFGGLEAANVNADLSLGDLSLTYTFCPTFLGAHYTVSVSIPYVWVDVEAKISINPRFFRSLHHARTKTVRDGTPPTGDYQNGISRYLNWTVGDLQINQQFR